jgi:serine O-acetyltransferase
MSIQHLELVEPHGAPPVWAALRNQAEAAARAEPALYSMLNSVIMQHSLLEDALSYQLARKLADYELEAMSLRELCEEAYAASPELVRYAEADLKAVFERDPACKGYLQPFLFFKGFQALQTYRIAHWLWGRGRETLAFYLQSRMSEIFQVDISPAARIGSGVFFDHGTGIVIGETAVVEDDVSIMQDVTLGGTGKESGDRHPKIRRGVLLSLGAKILGNIEIGEYSRVGAGSVVLKSVPPGCTAVGVPAKLVNCDCGQNPSQQMNHYIDEQPDNTG